LWPLPEELTEETLELRLYPPPAVTAKDRRPRLLRGMCRKIRCTEFLAGHGRARDRKEIPCHVWQPLQNALAHHAKPKLAKVKLRAHTEISESGTSRKTV
jgi:hypothetical protein